MGEVYPRLGDCRITMGGIIECSPIEAKEWLDSGELVLIDVREDNELVHSRVPGAVHIPMSRFNPDNLPLSRGKKVAFLCAQGIRSYQVGEYLVINGLLDEAYNITGGLAAWMQANIPITKL